MISESGPGNTGSDLIDFFCLREFFLLELGESRLLIISLKPMHQLFHLKGTAHLPVAIQFFQQMR